MNTNRQAGMNSRRERPRRSMAAEIGMTALLFPFYWPSRSAGGKAKSQRKLKDYE